MMRFWADHYIKEVFFKVAGISSRQGESKYIQVLLEIEAQL